MQNTSTFGTSFLDLLTCSLIAVLIVFVVAPEEDEPQQALKLATIELLPGSNAQVRARIVACIELNGLRSCSPESSKDDIQWSSSPGGTVLTATWTDADSGPVRYWVGLEDLSTLAEGLRPLQIRIVDSDGRSFEHVLNLDGRFQILGEL